MILPFAVGLRREYSLPFAVGLRKGYSVLPGGRVYAKKGGWILEELPLIKFSFSKEYKVGLGKGSVQSTCL